MASDWIKVLKSTPDKPELLYAARECTADHAAIFLAWFRIWSYLDEHADDTGFVPLLSRSDGDNIGQVSGFCLAMESAGWLEFTDAGCLAVKWDRHNSHSAKRRLVEAEKKRRQRAGQAGDICPDVGGTEAGLEGRRRKKKESKPPPKPPAATGGMFPSGCKSWKPARQKATRIGADNSPLMNRIGAMFNRRPSTRWNVYEALRLEQLGEIAEDELATLEAWFADPANYHRNDLGTLLNNWDTELDRARKPPKPESGSTDRPWDPI